MSGSTSASWPSPDFQDRGIDLKDVFDVLETEGVDRFITSWEELQATVAKALTN